MKYASLRKNVKPSILHCAVFKHTLCVTIRKFPDAYTPLCGIVLPLIRHCGEISIFSHRVIQCYLYDTMRKIAGAHASTCGFSHYSLYGAIPLLQSRDASICGKIKTHLLYYADFQSFCCSHSLYVLLVMQRIFGAIKRMTTHGVMLFIFFGDHDIHKNECNFHHFSSMLKSLELSHWNNHRQKQLPEIIQLIFVKNSLQ